MPPVPWPRYRPEGRSRPRVDRALWAGVAGRSDLVGLAFATGDEAAVWVPSAVLAARRRAASLAQLLSDDRPGVRVHQAKALMRSLYEVGLDLRSLELDTSIAAYLLDPAESRYAISDLLARYTGLELGAHQSDELQLDLDGSSVDDSMVAALDAVATARLAPALENALEHQGMRMLYDTIENPLVRVLARMERVGVGVDVAELRALNDRLVSECGRLEKAIQEEAGIEFNVNSTHQLREVLFDKLGLAPQKKTKTGYSTDAASLERLLDQHPIIELLLSYREVEKLRGTYGEGLLNEVAPDGRIHARSTRRSRGPVGSPRINRTSTTSPCAATKAGSSARRSCRRRASSCSSPTTTRSSCGASRTSPRIQGSSQRSTRAPTSTPRPRRVCSVWTRTR